MKTDRISLYVAPCNFEALVSRVTATTYRHSGSLYHGATVEAPGNWQTPEHYRLARAQWLEEMSEAFGHGGT